MAKQVINQAQRKGGFAIGSIAATNFASTGNKSITGVGFTPKLVRLTYMATGTGATQTGYGAMTTTSQYYASSSTDTGTGRARNSGTDGCLGVGTSAGALYLKASYVSMDSDGFTINVSIAEGSFNIEYEAYA